MNKKRKFLHILIFIAVFAAAVAVVMLLWNALVPAIIGWGSITYLQAAGLMVLCRLLFGGLGRKHHGWGCRDHHHRHDRHEHFHELREAMKGMSRDERREFIRERMKYASCEKQERPSQHKEEQHDSGE